jgi:DnaJ-class molecular chaperone
VPTSTAQPELKAAYRKLALQLHPDVNPADDAGQRFAEVADAALELPPRRLPRTPPSWDDTP